MKTRLISLLAAAFVAAVGFHGAPAKAGPSVSLAFEGFFAASNLPLTFEGIDDQLDLNLPSDVIDAMDALAGDGYGAIFGLHYDIMVDDPAPATPRDWLLSLDLSIEGMLAVLLNGPIFIPFDESDLGLPSSLSGIPVGTFSVNDLAFIGGLIFDEILDPCAGPPAVVIASDIGACLYIEGMGGPLSGDLYAGLTPEFTEFLLDELFGFDPPPFPYLAIGEFEGEATLTTEVSEPGTLAILGLGLVAAAFARRRYIR